MQLVGLTRKRVSHYRFLVNILKYHSLAGGNMKLPKEIDHPRKV